MNITSSAIAALVPNFGCELDLEFSRDSAMGESGKDEKQFAVRMSGHYTIGELLAIANDLRAANAVRAAFDAAEAAEAAAEKELLDHARNLGATGKELDFDSLRIAVLAGEECAVSMVPGHVFRGAMPEAAEYGYERGTIGYALFLEGFLNVIRKVQIVTDANGIIVSADPHA
jgi:hypothetical protein